MRLHIACALASSLGFLVSPSVSAHVGLGEVGFAGQRQVLDFTVGHGCEGADTVSVEVRLPPEITSVRAVPWAFGHAEVMKDEADIPIAVIWTKADAADFDDHFYTVSLRITVPETPFETLSFPTVQTCRSADGEETVVDWIGLPDDEDEPAPVLRIVPARHPGWNKLTLEQPLSDLSFFDDAEIVWQGDAAYSSNPTTMALITTEPGVTVLAAITPGTDVWVRY